MKINDRIAQVAEEFEGLVEVISNAEWDDRKTKGKDPRAAKFEEMIKRAGHQDGWPYCASFVEGVWRVAYAEAGAPAATLALVAKLLTPHVMTSFRNCKEAGLVSQTPVRGAVMFMQNGKTDSGHAGLVLSFEAGWVNTIEANTSPDDPNERDGGAGSGGVFRKRHRLSFEPRNKGLWLRGFLNPLVT
jgi:hypothetical protein